jgi:hypothetical protein
VVYSVITTTTTITTKLYRRANKNVRVFLYEQLDKSALRFEILTAVTIATG